jgi:hypothetical protein
VEPDIIAPLLGDALDFQLVDRVGLTSFQIESHPKGERLESDLQKHDRPVEFARVLLPAHEQLRNSIKGWPIWFTRKVGRGEIVFSTLGYRGWVRPRLTSERAAPMVDAPFFPVLLPHLDPIALTLEPQREKNTFSVESFQPMLTAEIGYSVVGRGTVMLTFGGFLLSGLALGIVLRRSSRPELLGWLGPAAALGAAAAFFVMGESSRRSAPPTVAIGQIIDAVSGRDEAAVSGLLALYRPESGLVEAGAEDGGFFELDMYGIEGQTRRLVLTDMDAWHWENLTLPTGVRAAPFHDTLRIKEALRAIGHFGPEGLEGKITGPCQDLTDAVLSTLSGRNLAIHLGSNGSFRTGPSDILPKGEFITGAILSDEQQQRQEIYRAFFKEPRSGKSQGGGNVLLGWAKPFDLPFLLAPEARRVGSALVVVPLQLERPAPGTRVIVPGPLVSYQRIVDAGPIRPVLEGRDGIDMHLRFQLPRELLPFTVERARLTLKIDAPSRSVTIAGLEDSRAIQLHSEDSPLDPMRVEISEQRLLHLDTEGGLHLKLTLSNMLLGDQKAALIQQLTEKWIIDFLELEVGGRTAPDE